MSTYRYVPSFPPIGWFQSGTESAESEEINNMIQAAKNRREFNFNEAIKILEEENVILTCDNKDYHVEKCNIEFSDVYSL